jgi:hypothetical protein
MSSLQRLLEDPARFKWLKRGFYATLVLIAAAEVVLPILFHDEEAHHYFAFEGWPAFGSAYGFLSCVVIILVSKFIGKKWLMRNEDHYSHEWQEDGDDA